MSQNHSPLFRNFSARLALLAVTLVPASAWAYRPFDGTDADVAKLGEFELEFQPAGYLSAPSGSAVVAPDFVANFGLLPRWELVVEGRGIWPRSAARASLQELGVFGKHVIVEGILQDAPGMSVATEVGPLLPGIHGDSGFGGHAAVLVSRGGAAGILHGNGAFQWTRQGHPAALASIIAEANQALPLRPVAEVGAMAVKGTGLSYSGLFGAILTANPELAFDLAIKGTIAPSERIWELRLGVTWTRRMWTRG